jgi:hypothetical protein
MLYLGCYKGTPTKEHAVNRIAAARQASTDETQEYVTMTVDGGHGSSYWAASAEDAAKAAEADGYKVLDIMDNILVIAG